MKIGFDAKRAAQNRTGLGNYSRFILRMLSTLHPDNEYHLYIPNPQRTPYLKEIPALSALHLHFPATALWKRLRSLWRVYGVTADLRRDGIEIFHGLSNELPLNIRRAGCKSVVTIHDLIFLRNPEYYHWIDRKIYNYKFRKACRNADRIIAVSEFTKTDIINFYGIPADRIDVVYQGCDPLFSQAVPEDRLSDVARRYELPERFVLYVGSIEERKNAALLVEAARRAADECQPFHVVFVGRSTRYAEQLKERLKAMSCGPYCHFYHDVPYADLPSFYRLATVFVYPSRIEGFGIPMLEAISSGVPAIGCTGSCLEEAGGPDSLYVDPDRPDILKETITRLYNDEAERLRMIEAGKVFARRFSDERLCADLMAVYRKL